MRKIAVLALGMAWGVAFASPEQPVVDRGAPKVGVLQFAAVGVSADFAGSVAGVVANELDRTGAFRVSTSQAIGELLALERQKQLLGCSENESCMAEIVDALGLDLMVSGKVVKVAAASGTKWTADLTLTNVRAARREGSQVISAGSESDLLEQVRAATRQLVAPILRARSGTLKVAVSEPGATVKVDDIPVGTTPLTAPIPIAAGLHQVSAEKKGFLIATGQARVAPGVEATLELTLVPSADYAREYEENASRMRLGAWISTGIAGAALITGGAMQLRANALYGDAATPDTFNFYRAFIEGGQESDGVINYRTRANAIASDIHSTVLISRIAFGAAGVAAAAGAFFWIAGEAPGRYTTKVGAVSLGIAPGAIGFSVALP